MTIQTVGIGRTAYPDLSYAPASPRALDKLSTSKISKKIENQKIKNIKS